ncbi:MAG TPA: S49 family peptidase [Vicinamibacterales bacterium]|nr:S49 family peptidase [Vicinamibacterales bacterium]
MTPETAALMRSARSKKPVVGAVFGLNASAAYWISSNATRLEATSSARVGSIGVYSQRVSVARMLEKDGVDIEIFSAGKYKAEGDPSTAITDDERMARQADVDESYANFISDVSFGRGIAASIIRAGFGQGRVVSAPEALRLRMIDSVSLVEDTVARTAAGAFPMPQSATAWANQVERAIFELSLPSAEPTPTSAAMLRQQIELERLEMEIALL